MVKIVKNTLTVMMCNEGIRTLFLPLFSSHKKIHLYPYSTDVIGASLKVY